MATMKPVALLAMPTTNSGRIAVVTADIVGSSRYAATARRNVDHVLRAGFRETRRAYKNALRGRLSFRITAGDEFQWIVEDPAKALETLTYLRAVVASSAPKLRLHFRAAIGIGEIAVRGKGDTYEQDGIAFVRARQGLEAFSGRRGATRWTTITTGQETTDRTVDAILSIADFHFSRWSPEQWEAIRWTLHGESREAIAKRLRISTEAVRKRLKTAGWPNLEPALRLVATLTQ